jgi:SAM-dependent methyltransferase
MAARADNPYGQDPSRPEDYREMDLTVVRPRWDAKARRWDADLADEHCHLNEDGAYDRFLTTGEAIVAERAEFCRRHLLVDLGCGTAAVLARFIGQFAEGLGIDISGQMLAVAGDKHLPRCSLQEGNGFELGRFVQPGAAGAVMSRGILLSHFGPQWAGLLCRQIHQALAPGGFALLDFLNADARQSFASNPDNKAYYSPPELEAIARQAGFGGGRILGEPAHRVLMLLLERAP